MSNHPNRLIMSQARDIAPVEDLEDTSFIFHGRVGGLIENASHLTVAFWGPVAMTDSRALVVARAGADP